LISSISFEKNVKNLIILVFIMLFQVQVGAQLYLYDTITCDNIYNCPEFRECLKTAHTMSKAAFTIGANAIWLAPVEGMSMNDNNSNWALGFAGTGFVLSIIPAISLREARMILRQYGYDKIPGNELYQAVTRAQAMSTATAVSGIAFLSLAIYGQYSKSDVAFGIGLGGTLASAALSIFVPIMINDALEIYNRGAPISLKLGPTKDGIGMVCRF
jgi:hypothetical protein